MAYPGMKLVLFQHLFRVCSYSPVDGRVANLSTARSITGRSNYVYFPGMLSSAGLEIQPVPRWSCFKTAPQEPVEVGLGYCDSCWQLGWDAKAIRTPRPVLISLSGLCKQFSLCSPEKWEAYLQSVSEAHACPLSVAAFCNSYTVWLP